MYVYHWDVPNKRWNVFDETGSYVTHFEFVVDAINYCDVKNTEIRLAKQEQEKGK